MLLSSNLSVGGPPGVTSGRSNLLTMVSSGKSIDCSVSITSFFSSSKSSRGFNSSTAGLRKVSRFCKIGRGPDSHEDFSSGIRASRSELKSVDVET